MRENCQKAIDAHINMFHKLNVLVNNSAMQEISEDITQIDLTLSRKLLRPMS